MACGFWLKIFWPTTVTKWNVLAFSFFCRRQKWKKIKYISKLFRKSVSWLKSLKINLPIFFVVEENWRSDLVRVNVLILHLALKCLAHNGTVVDIEVMFRKPLVRTVNAVHPSHTHTVPHESGNDWRFCCQCFTHIHSQSLLSFCFGVNRRRGRDHDNKQNEQKINRLNGFALASIRMNVCTDNIHLQISSLFHFFLN